MKMRRTVRVTKIGSRLGPPNCVLGTMSARITLVHVNARSATPRTRPSRRGTSRNPRWTRASDTVGDPVVINFDQGLPDPELFPLEILEQCLVDTLRDDGADALKYFGAGGPEEMQRGALGLRERLAEWIGRRDGRVVGAASVLLVNGSTDGLALAVRGLLASGDGAIVEAATYQHMRNYLLAAGASVRTVPLDDHGMVVDRLDDALRALRADGASEADLHDPHVPGAHRHGPPTRPAGAAARHRA